MLSSQHGQRLGFPPRLTASKPGLERRRRGLFALPSDSVGCALIIPMIIQTILLYLSGAVWTDEAPNLSSLDPSGAIQIDAEHPTTDLTAKALKSASGRRRPA
jgi:hypothetical protein